MSTPNNKVFTYIATNTKNGKFDTGSTGNFEKRKESHSSPLRNYPFQNALRNNPDSFEGEVVLGQSFLDKWSGTEMRYNLNKHACGGCSKLSEKTKLKKSQARKSETLTERYKAALSAARKGMKFTKERKRNISLSKIGQGHASGDKGKNWYCNVNTLETRMFTEHPGEGWCKGRKP